MKITYRTAVRNIRNLLAEIPESTRLESQNWYLRAHQTIALMECPFVTELGGSLEQEAKCHIVAALSPGSVWTRNLEDARHLIARYPNLYDFRPNTYPAQAAKAIRILQLALASEEAWRTVLKGPKERAFAQNLAYPEAERELTLDFHAYSIASNFRWTHETVPQFGVAAKAAVERAYRTVAAENNLKVCQLQAVTWEWWRKTRPAPRFQKTKGKVIAA